MLRIFKGRIVDTNGRHETWRWTEVPVTLKDVLSLETSKRTFYKFQFSVRDGAAASILNQLPTAWYMEKEWEGYTVPKMVILDCDPVLFQAELASSHWERAESREWYEWTKEE